MRALIVDDEPLARKVLREELECCSGVEVVGDAEDGEQALRLISEVRPDLVFLDLQMPGMTGFDVIRKLDRGRLPAIVVVTAYDQHAVRAFEEGAIDYLLKPVRTDRLLLTLERVSRLANQPLHAAEQVARLHEIADAKQPSPPRKIVGRIGEEYFLLNPEEILAFQAEGDTVCIITARRRYIASLTLKGLQEKLQGLPFQRVHRNALVNLLHIRKMAALSSQRWLLTMHNNQEFIVSKRQAKAVRELLSW